MLNTVTGVLEVPTFVLPQSYTKIAWAYAKAIGGTPNFVSSPNKTGGWHYFFIINNKLSGGHNLGDPVVYINDTTDLPINTWTHVAITYDRTSNTLTIYKNGVQVAKSTTFGAWNGANTGLEFGGVTNTAFLNGYIDDVRLFSRGLTASEVAAYYAAG